MKRNSRLEKEQAWIGDAVLGLFSRTWILKNKNELDAEMFSRMTSNHFLNSMGQPTKVEAEIGKVYNQKGLEKSFEYIEFKILPLFLKQEKKINRIKKGKKDAKV